MLSVVMHSFVTYSLIGPSAVMLRVVIPSVTAPGHRHAAPLLSDSAFPSLPLPLFLSSLSLSLFLLFKMKTVKLLSI